MRCIDLSYVQRMASGKLSSGTLTLLKAVVRCKAMVHETTSVADDMERTQAVRISEVGDAVTEIEGLQEGDWVVITKIDKGTGAEIGSRHKGIVTHWVHPAGSPIRLHQPVYLWFSLEEKARAESSEKVIKPRRTDPVCDLYKMSDTTYLFDTASKKKKTYKCEIVERGAVSSRTAETQSTDTAVSTRTHDAVMTAYEKQRSLAARTLLSGSGE